MTGPRYPSFGAADLERALAEARPALAGARVRRVRERGAGAFAIEARRAPEGEAHLLISLDPRFARLHLVPGPPAPAGGRSPFGDLLRARLEGDRIAGIEQVPGSRAARIRFERGQALLLELFPPAPNAHLLEEDGTIAGAARPRPPRGPAPAGGTIAVRPPLVPEIAPDPATLAYSRALAALFAEAEARAARADERRAIAAEIARRQKKLDAATRKLGDAIAAAARAEGMRRIGDALLASLHLLRRGQTEVTVPDPHAGGAPLRVELDPALRPAAQAERYFKRAKKLRRGGEVARARLGALEAERGRLEGAVGVLAALPEDADLAPARAAAGLRPASARPERGRRRGPEKTKGGRRFRSRDGLEIVVGRTDAENDRLTREARGNDLFLHVQGFAGSHVIVRAAPGKPVPLETMLDAAALAVHYSKARDFPKAEVSVTPRKYVRKPRGTKPGLVVLERHDTLLVARDRARLERVLATAARADDEGAAENRR